MQASVSFNSSFDQISSNSLEKHLTFLQMNIVQQKEQLSRFRNTIDASYKQRFFQLQEQLEKLASISQELLIRCAVLRIEYQAENTLNLKSLAKDLIKEVDLLETMYFNLRKNNIKFFAQL